MAAKFKRDSYIGTGASLNISVGFIPEALIIINVSDGTPVVFWDDLMPGGTSVDMAAAAGSNAAGSISAFPGASANGMGFSTGVDNSVNGKVYHYIAFAGA